MNWPMAVSSQPSTTTQALTIMAERWDSALVRAGTAALEDSFGSFELASARGRQPFSGSIDEILNHSHSRTQAFR